MLARKDKMEDADLTRKYLEEGNHFYGPKAASLGLIDRVTTPDKFFKEHFDGKTYTIGEPKTSLFTKLGLDKLFGGSSSVEDSLFDGIFDDESIFGKELTDPVSHFQETALRVPQFSRESFL